MLKITVISPAIFSMVMILSGCSVFHLKSLPFSSTLSSVSNPSGSWQIGYSSGSALDVNTFQPCTYVDTSHIISIWHPVNGAAEAAYYPYTGQNNTAVTQLDPTGSWAARPGEIVMEGSSTGQYSMLQFTAPVQGKYKINVVFEGVHFRLSTTDVHVLLNAQSLFSDSINGYGGDSLFHAIQGSRPSVSYSDSMQLQKGDVITFALGYGPNKTNFNDTSGLIIYIELVA